MRGAWAGRGPLQPGDDEGEREGPAPAPGPGTPSSGGGPPRDASSAHAVVPGFLLSLHAMVGDDELREFVSWSQDGTSFRFCAPMRFATNAMPKYFAHGNFDTFLRQLSHYGFRRVAHDAQFQYYAHDDFRAGRKDLLRNIRRKTVGSRGARQRTSSTPRPSHVPKSGGLAGPSVPLVQESSLASIERQHQELFRERDVLRQHVQALKEDQRRCMDSLQGIISTLCEFRLSAEQLSVLWQVTHTLRDVGRTGPQEAPWWPSPHMSSPLRVPPARHPLAQSPSGPPPLPAHNPQSSLIAGSFQPGHQRPSPPMALGQARAAPPGLHHSHPNFGFE